MHGELDEEVHLQVRCSQCKPSQRAQHEYDRTVPKYLVSGIIIAFHSSHEGHQLEIIVDGDTYFP